MSECLITRSGDVVAAQFADEDTTVLFVPDSGEVIKCVTQDWTQLVQNKSGPPSELALTLNNLGVHLG